MSGYLICFQMKVRHARHGIRTKTTDLKEMMKKIEAGLANIHAQVIPSGFYIYFFLEMPMYFFTLITHIFLSFTLCLILIKFSSFSNDLKRYLFQARQGVGIETDITNGLTLSNVASEKERSPFARVLVVCPGIRINRIKFNLIQQQQ